MKRKLIVTVFVLVVSFGYAQNRKLRGKVLDGNNNPMENVAIQVLDKDISTFTDSDGTYQIQVDTGDRVQYAYTGMRDITIQVEDVTRILNPIMIPDVEELEEVTIEASKRLSQKDLEEDYIINKNIIKTAWGYLDSDRAPGNVRTIDESEINIVNVNLANLLMNRFPGVTVGSGGLIYIRGISSLSNNQPAIFDIDGQIFAPNLVNGQFTQIPTLDLGNIKRIAVLNNLANTIMYGTLGNGGVIVINTFTGSPSISRITDQARLRNNYANQKVLSIAEVLENGPTYLKELEASSSFKAAQSIFEGYETTYINSPYFYLDAYHYFMDRWGEDDYAQNIINENYGLFMDNPVLLKALAYTYQSLGEYSKANEMYKEVFILRPNYAQSYLDMASSYRDLKEPKQAATLYARYGYLLEERFMERDTIGFGPLINREFNNLLVLEGRSVLERRQGNQGIKLKEEFEGTRLVFEWNDGEAEFDLQFVNPENQYYQWKHTLAENEAAIQREKEFGYNTKEYLVDDSMPGLWKVNLNYLGNKSLTPTYMKATVYHNYGSRSQRKEVQVFKLDLKDVNQELFKFNVSGNVASQ